MLRAFVIGLGLSVGAAAPAAPPPAVGALILVDAGGRQVKVAGTNGWEAWFKLSATTRVTVRGEPAALEDLRPGYRVAVTCKPVSVEATRIDAAP